MERIDNVILKVKVSKYDRIFDFSEERGLVFYNQKYGFIDKNGFEVIKPDYDDARGFKEGRAGVKKDNKWFFINKMGEKASLEYEHLRDFEGSYAVVKRKGKFGMIDKNGLEIIETKYDTIESLSDNLILVRENGVFKYININNQVILELPKTIMMAYPFKDGIARVTRKDSRKYFINKKGGKITDAIYDSTSDFNFGLASCWISLEGTTIIDEEGHELIPRTTNFIIKECLGNNRFLAVFGYKKQGIIDKYGNLITSKYYQEIYALSDGLIRVKDETSMYGFIDINGREAIPCKYKEVYDFHDDLALCRINHKYGFIDKNGFLVIPPIYDHANSFKDHVAVVTIDDEDFYIDKNNIPLDIKETKSKVIRVPNLNLVPPYVKYFNIKDSFIAYETITSDKVIKTFDISAYDEHLEKIEDTTKKILVK